MNLLIDLGNSRLKWVTSNSHLIDTVQAISHQQLNQESLLNTWQTLEQPENIAIACVTKRHSLSLVLFVVEQLWPNSRVIIANSLAYGYGVTNAYQHPEKLGVDRWLALIATHYYYPTTLACIVDCGTAITIDLLEANGKHLGGVICPGLTLMKQALSQGTESLPFDTTRYPLQPANFTEAGIYSGTLLAAIGLIEQFSKQQSSQPTIVLTGGDANLIANHLLANVIIDVNLVFKGLAIVIENNL